MAGHSRTPLALDQDIRRTPGGWSPLRAIQPLGDGLIRSMHRQHDIFGYGTEKNLRCARAPLKRLSGGLSPRASL